MNRYLKLVNFEFNRISRIFFILLAFTFVCEMAGVIVMSKLYLGTADYFLNEKLMTRAQFFGRYGHMGLIEVVRTPWFFGPMALCVAAVAFYIFLIWYRDWWGKNTFIYRLLTLPTARLNVFLAKITTILMMTFGFVAFQLILMPLENMILKSLVPEDFRTDMSMKGILDAIDLLRLIFPTHLIEFLINYGVGVTMVAIVFTGILFERSYHLKGIFIGACYCGAALIIFTLPILIQTFWLQNFFYPMELFVLMIVTGLMVLFGSVWMSNVLLKKKITV